MKHLVQEYRNGRLVVWIASKAPARSTAASRCAPLCVTVLTSPRSSSARPLSIPPSSDDQVSSPTVLTGDSLRHAPLAACRLPVSTAHRRPTHCVRGTSASLATDQSGHAASGRSGHLVSTPAPSALSVASPAGRRTRNRLVCWALASGGSPRGAGTILFENARSLRAQGDAREGASERAQENGCVVQCRVVTRIGASVGKDAIGGAPSVEITL